MTTTPLSPSADARQRRDALNVEFPAELPITDHVDEILNVLTRHQVIVVAGETGSGKTTQLPKICLAAGFGVERMIGHTQPRRLAARTVAQRIADEVGVPLGAEVGFAVRFSDATSEETRIKLLTDGLLLTEIRRDKLLKRYDVIIVDEAHERSLNIDFLLGYLKGVLKRRRDLKLIITSATIDVDAFASHFDDAPVVEVSGRTYPVQTRYLDEQQTFEPFEDQLLTVLEDIETGPQSRARDVLMFLAGEREILETSRFLKQATADRLEILPLYARLSAADQARVFKPGGRRRIVLATNVAETSLTVPNIGYVIDPGFARISRYSFRSKLQRLPVEPISQASADQRAGRCGRVAPGVCFRLYTEADFASRPEYTDPEIKRTNLASVVLQMRAFDLGDPIRFPFLEPPDPRMIGDAEKVLTELGALSGDNLTPVGRTMARLPVDPRLARMLIAADQTRALSEVLVIASALAVSDPRERPVEKQGSADRAHERWVDTRSDFIAYLNLWQWSEAERQKHTRSGFRKTLGRSFLSNNRMREWRALHRQLKLAVRDLKMRPNREAADYASVHRALLAGSLGLIGLHDERGEYLGPRNLKFRIFPGSALAHKHPKWLMAGEIVETRKVYARSVAQVEARWIEECAAHLVKRSHEDPHWSLKRGEAQVFERVTLYGLLLADRRRVSLRNLDRDTARNLFLLDGLVRGALRKPPEFLEHNLATMTGIREAEDKGRRRDLLLSESEIADLYDARLPVKICSVRDLDHWQRKASVEEVNGLFFPREMLCQDAAIRYTETDFPSQLELRGATFEVRYRFAPGEIDDGVSIQVPMGLLDVLVPQALEWSVPGLLSGVCEQWIRSLPKQKRRVLTPVPDTVQSILSILIRPDRYRQGRVDVALADLIEAQFGVQIRAGDWDRSRIDPHWLMNVQVIDTDGRLLDQGRDVDALKSRLGREVEGRLNDGLKDEHEETGLKDFPDQPLAPSMVLGRGDEQVVVYPALVDEGSSVALRHLLDQRQQASANRAGFARLALIKLGQTSRYLKKQLSGDKALGLLFAPLGDAATLTDEVLRSSVWHCFFAGEALPDDASSLNARLAQRRAELPEVFQSITTALRDTLEARLQLMRELDQAQSPAYADAVADIRHQVAALVPADVLGRTPPLYLSELPRYLKAASYRLSNLQGRVGKDREHADRLRMLSERLERIGAELGLESDQWRKLRFLLEEVRVGVFAERLGVKGKSSMKKLDAELKALERELGLI